MAGSVFAATDVATDPPDIRLLQGTPLNNAFNLDDYFSGTAGGSVNIAGSATIGVRTEAYTVGGIAVSNQVKVSSFLVQNGAVLDGASANPFVNVLRPGVAVNSAQALVGAPAGGGSPAGGSAPVWWITFASVTSSYDQGLRIRNTSLIAQSDGPTLQAGGLTATIAANGTYTLTADQNFAGPTIVTFISQAGDNLDGASVLASKSISVGTNFADNMDQARVVDGTGVPTGTQVALSEVAVGAGEVTLSVDVVPGTTGMSLAIAAINGGFDFNNLVYENPSASGTVAGQKMTIKCTFDPPADAVIPLLMAANGAATFSNLKVFKAPSLADLSIGANEIDLHSNLSPTGAIIDGNLNAVTDVSVLSPNQPNLAPGTVNLSTQNNFGASGKCVALGEATTFDNVSVLVVPDPGAICAHAWVKGNGHYDFVMTVFNAAGNNVDRAIGGSMTGDFANWSPISVAGSVGSSAMVWVTVQGVGGGQDALLVDDMKVLQVQDLDAYFDAGLFAL
jgi:hypothetical protein